MDAPPLMPAPLQKLLLVATLLIMAIGCQPKVGDECQISTDCSAAGDRLCDITAPGGYCTVFNCEPGACPEDEALCVQFGSQRSSAEACQDLQSPSPYARAFCMATCEDASDCRDGYVCEDLSKQNDWDAILIDRDRGNRACMVPVTAVAVDPSKEGNVCQAELPPEREPEPEPSSAGAGGQSAGGQAAGGESAGGQSAAGQDAGGQDAGGQDAGGNGG